VDLKGINRLWLERSGVLPEQIAVSDACTACDETTFYSHRRTGQPRGALTAVIQLS
jgi:copper oxidase (laccase) domain-containing protein